MAPRSPLQVNRYSKKSKSATWGTSDANDLRHSHSGYGPSVTCVNAVVSDVVLTFIVK